MFIEVWNNLSYYDTNLEKKGFASFLARYEGKIGLNLFRSPLQLYGVYYGMLSQADAYWDNSLFSGLGLRYKPFEGFAGTSWANEWISGVKIFAEKLNSSYLKGGASAEADDLATEDTRYGIDVWYEWNLDEPDERVPWGELWLNLSSRQTNFGWEPDGFNDWVLYFQPKFGCHLGNGIGLYLRSSVAASGKEGPSYSFLNIADYGVGIRFEPWRESKVVNDFLRKFKMFAEVVGVTYLKDKPSGSNNEVSSDVRFGVELSYGR